MKVMVIVGRKQVLYCLLIVRSEFLLAVKYRRSLCLVAWFLILFDNEYTWNPDNGFEGFVKNTLKTSGYDLLDFGYE